MDNDPQEAQGYHDCETDGHYDQQGPGRDLREGDEVHLIGQHHQPRFGNGDEETEDEAA